MYLDPLAFIIVVCALVALDAIIAIGNAWILWLQKNSLDDSLTAIDTRLSRLERK